MGELQAAIKLNPKNLSAMMLLGSAHENAKDYKAAAAAYEQMLEVDPKCPPALNNLAYLYSELLGQPDRAYELAQRAHDLQPFDPSTADTLGWICVKRGQYPTALALLQDSAAKLPNVPDVQYHLGMVNYLMTEAEAARAAFQLALAGGKDFIGRDECQLCLALLNIDPQTADAAAIEKLEKRVADRSDDPIAESRLGAIYQRDGRTDKAIACFEAVLKTDAKNLPAMNALTKLYEPKDPAKAYGIAKAAYKLAPNDAEVTHVYGRLAYQNGDFKLASTMLQSAVQNQPGDAALQFDYARAIYSIGRVPEAQTALQAAQAANLPEAKRMADLIAQADNPQPAASARVADILKAEPDYVPALMVQVKLSEQAGDLAGATAAGEKILAQFPGFCAGAEGTGHPVLEGQQQGQYGVHLCHESPGSLSRRSGPGQGHGNHRLSTGGFFAGGEPVEGMFLQIEHGPGDFLLSGSRPAPTEAAHRGQDEPATGVDLEIIGSAG